MFVPDELMSTRPTRDIWQSQPDLVRQFLSARPKYEQLAAEVAYILEKAVSAAAVEYSTVTNRAKTLNSFVEKLERKDYIQPLEQVTDLAGVRIVYLYMSDFAQIEEIIRTEFLLVERVDKQENHGVDRFGYSAIHFLVRLGPRTSGARYDELKDLVCEIQVRTVLQDAWAIIDHHLAYKQEAAVPKQLRRKLNSLAGLFETADDQFDRIRHDREAYVREVQSKINHPEQFLAQELNLDSLVAFLHLQYKGEDFDADMIDNLAGWLMRLIDKQRFPTLGSLKDAISQTEPQREAYYRLIGTKQMTRWFEPLLTLAILDRSAREATLSPEGQEKMERVLASTSDTQTSQR
jgi:putative GTP pyrophosphokinase